MVDNTDTWLRAQNLIQAWPDVPDLAVSGTCRRLRDALAGVGAGTVGWNDIAGLIRQILLEHEATHGGRRLPIRVPQAPPFPTREQWKQADCETLISSGDELVVTALPWQPPTRLATPTAEDAEVPGSEVPCMADLAAVRDIRLVYAGERKESQACPADPFWIMALGEDYDSYTSVGQRQAARTVVTAPPGSTTIVCLPTGQGKTEVALASALLATRDRGVAVLVAPTIILALDLARRIEGFFGRRGSVRVPAANMPTPAA